jgi:cytochrome c oxidase cbb3-type subunit 2
MLAGCGVPADVETREEAHEETGEETRTPGDALTTEWAVEDANAADRSLEYPKWQTVAPGEHARYNQRASLQRRGRLVYDKYCVGCHGELGDGKGPAAVRLLTQPRDFTSGVYKFRSTDSGSLPLETELHRTITRGLARVSMPAFPLIPEGEKVAVIEYIKQFYVGWDAEKDRRRIVPIPRAPTDLAEDSRIQRGNMVYLQMGCTKCHGTDGRGKGATQTEYVDAWGNPQKPFDFTRGSLKGGAAPEDIYRTFHTGLRSIMPSFGGDTMAAVSQDGFDQAIGALDPDARARLTAIRDQFPLEAAAVFSDMSDTDRATLATRNSWDLVAYVLSLRTSTSTARAVLGTD